MNLKLIIARGILWGIALVIMSAVVSPFIASFVGAWKALQWTGVLWCTLSWTVAGCIVAGILKLIGWAIDNC